MPKLPKAVTWRRICHWVHQVHWVHWPSLALITWGFEFTMCRWNQWFSHSEQVHFSDASGHQEFGSSLASKHSKEKTYMSSVKIPGWFLCCIGYWLLSNLLWSPYYYTFWGDYIHGSNNDHQSRHLSFKGRVPTFDAKLLWKICNPRPIFGMLAPRFISHENMWLSHPNSCQYGWLATRSDQTVDIPNGRASLRSFPHFPSFNLQICSTSHQVPDDATSGKRSYWLILKAASHTAWNIRIVIYCTKMHI